eukprot:scaffold213_cov245-Pinguiococcus_pyrenoidosus.AAC.2
MSGSASSGKFASGLDFDGAAAAAEAPRPGITCDVNHFPHRCSQSSALAHRFPKRSTSSSPECPGPAQRATLLRGRIQQLQLLARAGPAQGPPRPTADVGADRVEALKWWQSCRLRCRRSRCFDSPTCIGCAKLAICGLQRQRPVLAVHRGLLLLGLDEESGHQFLPPPAATSLSPSGATLERAACPVPAALGLRRAEKRRVQAGGLPEVNLPWHSCRCRRHRKGSDRSRISSHHRAGAEHAGIRIGGGGEGRVGGQEWGRRLCKSPVMIRVGLSRWLTSRRIERLKVCQMLMWWTQLRWITCLTWLMWITRIVLPAVLACPWGGISAALGAASNASR